MGDYNGYQIKHCTGGNRALKGQTDDDMIRLVQDVLVMQLNAYEVTEIYCINDVFHR